MPIFSIFSFTCRPRRKSYQGVTNSSLSCRAHFSTDSENANKHDLCTENGVRMGLSALRRYEFIEVRGVFEVSQLLSILIAIFLA